MSVTLSRSKIVHGKHLKTPPPPRLFWAVMLFATGCGAGFLWGTAWPLVLIGTAPLIAAVYQAASPRQASAIGFMGGWALHAISLSGIFWGSWPLGFNDSMPAAYEFSLVCASWLVTSAALATGTLVFALFFRIFQTRTRWDALVVPSVWVVGEWFGSLFFSVVSVGSGSLLAPHFGVVWLGNLVAYNTELLQIAYLGGGHVLGAMCALLGYFAYQGCVQPIGERWKPVLAYGLILGVWYLAGALVIDSRQKENPEISIPVAALATQDPATVSDQPTHDMRKSSNVLALLQQTKDAALVVFPEHQNFLGGLRKAHGNQALSVLQTVYTTPNLPTLLDSASVHMPGGALRSSAELLNLANNTSVFRHKYFFVPNGEYVPYIIQSPLRLLGMNDVLEQVSKGKAYQHAGTPQPYTSGAFTFGVLFCNETMSPTLYKDLANAGSEFFVNVASHSWFHGSHLVADQMRMAARIRAVESRRWYVQSTNVSPAFVLDALGRVVAQSSWGQTTVIQATIGLNKETTPYMRWGWLMPGGCALLTLMLWLGWRTIHPTSFQADGLCKRDR